MTRVINILIMAMIAFAVLSLIYVVAPILIPLILVVALLGLLTWGIVSLARELEKRLHRNNGSSGR